MLSETDAEITTSITDYGSIMFSSTSFAEIPANTEISISVKIINPNDRVTCPEHSLEVF